MAANASQTASGQRVECKVESNMQQHHVAPQSSGDRDGDAEEEEDGGGGGGASMTEYALSGDHKTSAGAVGTTSSSLAFHSDLDDANTPPQFYDGQSDGDLDSDADMEESGSNSALSSFKKQRIAL